MACSSRIWLRCWQHPVARTVDLGEVLVSGNGFVLPFEVASLLLTAAMIGAIVIARDADREVE